MRLRMTQFMTPVVMHASLSVSDLLNFKHLVFVVSHFFNKKEETLDKQFRRIRVKFHKLYEWDLNFP